MSSKTPSEGAKIPRKHPRTKDGTPIYIGSTLWYIGGLPEDAPVDSGVVRMIDGEEIHFEPTKRVKWVIASVTWSTRRAALTKTNPPDQSGSMTMETKKHTPENEKCCAKVSDGGRWPHYYPCKRRATCTHEGKRYCAQHNPNAVAARRKARNAEWDAKWKAERKEAERNAACIEAMAGIPDPAKYTQSVERLVELLNEWTRLNADPNFVAGRNAIGDLRERTRAALADMEKGGAD